ncbi:MAG: ATP-binding cassette domain-containing protein [Chloracidobacterium sp.]|nr:ATP-binding cassette domain-containing protein [Chloracidobacterium sp.]
MSEVLQISNLTTGYAGKAILRDVSFSVPEGDVLAVIGQNGSGKSTLLKTIARIITDNSGDVILDSVKINDLQTWDLKKLGMTYFVQGGMVFPTMKVKEHFDMVLRDYDKATALKIKDECLSYFPALSDFMETRGGNLSGGQRQMLSFAMMIAQKTKCWLLDEPTAGLAPESVKESTTFLRTMKEVERTTMVLVEHNYQVAFELADRVAVIKNGKLYNIFEKDEFQKEDFLDRHLFN